MLSITDDNVCVMKSAIWKINEDKLDLLTLLPTSQFGNDIKHTLFHISDPTKALSIIDNHYVIWDFNESDAKVRITIILLNTHILLLGR